MKFLKLLSLGILLLLSYTALYAQLDRDPEVLYLKAGKEIILITNQAAGVYATRSFTPLLKTFPQDTEVLLKGYHPAALLVTDRRTGYEGWIALDTVPELDPKMIALLKAEDEEEKTFALAIKKEEVLPGMSFENVQQALGKPTNKTFREDEKGRLDVWSYVDYERITEYRQAVDPVTRQVISIPYTVKIPIGSLNVEFKNSRVAAIERTQDAQARSRR